MNLWTGKYQVHGHINFFLTPPSEFIYCTLIFMANSINHIYLGTRVRLKFLKSALQGSHNTYVPLRKKRNILGNFSNEVALKTMQIKEFFPQKLTYILSFEILV